MCGPARTLSRFRFPVRGLLRVSGGRSVVVIAGNLLGRRLDAQSCGDTVDEVEVGRYEDDVEHR